MSRITLSLAEPGGTRRNVPGSSHLPCVERQGGKQHMRKAIEIWQTIEIEDGETRAVWAKLDCLKFNRQWLKTGPMGKRLKPIPFSALVFNPDQCTLLRSGRWPMRSLKPMN